MFNQVYDFHKVFNIYIALSPEFPVQNIRDLRKKLLREEVDEFKEAYDARDMVEMADALGDICYIIAGTCVSYGICPEVDFDSPYDGVLKQTTLYMHKKLDNVLNDIALEYENAEDRNDFDGVKSSLMNLISCVFGVALHLGIPFNEVFEVIHHTNMAKAPDGKPRYRADGKILKPEGWKPPTDDIRAILERLNIAVYKD